MNHEIYKHFLNNTLTKKFLIRNLLTSLGSGLYSYLLMLKNSDRKEEATLIENHRKSIFDMREAYENDKASYADIEKVLTQVYNLLNVQIIMIRRTPGIHWEGQLLDSYMNDMKLIIFSMQDEQEKKV